MTRAALRHPAEPEPIKIHRAPFCVLAVGECRTVKPLLERIVNAAPQVELHTWLPDAAGLCALRGHAPDLILVDADSPHYSAARLCDFFKHNLETRTVPLIVVSCSVRACEEALAQGADDFVTPQTRPALMLRRIEALVQVRQARQFLQLEDQAMGEPRFPPLQWQARGVAEESPSRVKFGQEALGSTPAVVLFADLRGYTRLCERLAPGQVVPLLNECFSLLTQITLEHQGAVFNTAGDCLMAGFDPSPVQTGASDRALRAAQKMRDRFSSLADSWLKRLDVAVGLGLGLNMGEVAIAPTGFPSFTHYTLIGDAVNVAARLCQRARAGEIVLSASFKQTLTDKGAGFAITPLPPLSVRGRTEPVQIFCLPLEQRGSFIESISGADLRLSQLECKAQQPVLPNGCVN